MLPTELPYLLPWHLSILFLLLLHFCLTMQCLWHSILLLFITASYLFLANCFFFVNTMPPTQFPFLLSWRKASSSFLLLGFFVDAMLPTQLSSLSHHKFPLHFFSVDAMLLTQLPSLCHCTKQPFLCELFSLVNAMPITQLPFVCCDAKHPSLCCCFPAHAALWTLLPSICHCTKQLSLLHHRAYLLSMQCCQHSFLLFCCCTKQLSIHFHCISCLLCHAANTVFLSLSLCQASFLFTDHLFFVDSMPPTQLPSLL